MTDYVSRAVADGSLKKYVDQTRKWYGHAAAVTVEAIKAHLHLPHLMPQGGLYTCIRVDENGAGFVERVLRDTGVLLIPGWGFGSTLSKSVRLSYGPHVHHPERITEGLHRVAQYLGTCK